MPGSLHSLAMTTYTVVSLCCQLQDTDNPTRMHNRHGDYYADAKSKASTLARVHNRMKRVLNGWMFCIKSARKVTCLGMAIIQQPLKCAIYTYITEQN